jgi:uncharacterized protein DUF4255
VQGRPPLELARGRTIGARCPIGKPSAPERRAARRCRAQAIDASLPSVIHEIDESLRRLVLREAVNGSGVELSFEAPTREWAAKRNAPTINIYLYDIRENLEQREIEYEEIRDDNGRVTERRQPPRRFTLSYLVTVWTQRPEDEHRVLASLLACFLKSDRLPGDVLTESLASQPYAIRTTVALPPPKDRSLADVWSALGGELKASLDLVLTVPFDAGRVLAAGPPVLVPPEVVAQQREDRRSRETVGGERDARPGAR